MERLQKIIAESGYCSRRKAEELITSGKVEVNGQVVKELGTKASFGDQITVCGTSLNREEKEYYMLYKPRGVVCTTSDDKGRKTVLDFFNTNKRIYPIGRLDYDATGLLLLTNDGEFANLMMHPSSLIDKDYIAKVEGVVTGEDVKKLKQGIVIEKQMVKPTRVKVKKVNYDSQTTIVEITVHDGKNHEVKKLFETVNHEVIKLKRESFGILVLGDLKSGEKRKLSIKEVRQMHALATQNKLSKN